MLVLKGLVGLHKTVQLQLLQCYWLGHRLRLLWYWISLEGMMLKLKLQYFGHLMQRVDSLEKTLMLGGIGGRADWEKSGARSWTSSLGTPVTLSQLFQPLNPQTDAEAETLVLWPPHVKSWLIGKDSDAGRDWGQEEKGTTEDEMVGWQIGRASCRERV